MLFLQSALPRPLLLQKKSQWLLLSCKKCQLSPARTLQRSFGTQTETFRQNIIFSNFNNLWPCYALFKRTGFAKKRRRRPTWSRVLITAMVITIFSFSLGVMSLTHGRISRYTSLSTYWINKDRRLASVWQISRKLYRYLFHEAAVEPTISVLGSGV